MISSSFTGQPSSAVSNFRVRKAEKTIASLFLVALSTAALPALAQEAPDLVGSWTGSSTAVHVGSTPYRQSDEANETVAFGVEPIQFTYRVTEQRGNLFSGDVSMSGGDRTETLIGALRPNNAGGIMQDDDGELEFTLRDENTMDICYMDRKPTSRVVTCWTMTRQ